MKLSSPGPDPLDPNPEAQPPDRKFAQVEQGVDASERSALVHREAVMAGDWTPAMVVVASYNPKEDPQP